MKKTLLAFIAVLFATLMFPGLIRPPAEIAMASKVRVQELAHALGTALEEYREEFGHYPEGTSGEIMRALRGGNEKGRIFFDCPREALNDHGELLDPWGTPFRITYDPALKTPHIHSAGPNLISEERSAIAWMASDDFFHPATVGGK
jgi:hypothetical protein